jgi:hypothetical protein
MNVWLDSPVLPQRWHHVKWKLLSLAVDLQSDITSLELDDSYPAVNTGNKCSQPHKKTRLRWRSPFIRGCLAEPRYQSGTEANSA